MKNSFLFARTKELVATERRIGIAILDCLHEIERRKAYGELGYDGLFTYCVKELGFSDSQAYQRIQAMRALKDLPELKAKIESGSLNVSSITKVQAHLRQERRAGIWRPKTERLELFRRVEGQTSREVDKTLTELRGDAPMETIAMEVDSELAMLWRRVKDLAAHRTRGSETETLRLIAREWLARNDPMEKAKADAKKKKEKNAEPKVEDLESRRGVPSSTKPADAPPSAPSRYVATSLKRKVWARDGGRCTSCGSRHALEIDHRMPFAAGGTTTVENLRLLCRSCNRFAAVQAFGSEKIAFHAENPGRRKPLTGTRASSGKTDSQTKPA